MGNDVSNDCVGRMWPEQAEDFFFPASLECSDSSAQVAPSLYATYVLLKLGLGPIYSGAAPLSPLRKRDWVVLEDWFQPDSMPEIEADIHHNLLLRFPEPCWEDYIFEFLGEFL